MFSYLFKTDRRNLALPSFLFFKKSSKDRDTDLDPNYFSVEARWLWDNISKSSYRLS